MKREAPVCLAKLVIPVHLDLLESLEHMVLGVLLGSMESQDPKVTKDHQEFKDNRY